ncbi:MAG: helix-turn-helix transcriptional regulator [Bryobacteraceae bacterium]
MPTFTPAGKTLNARQLDVLHLLCRGLRNREIANHLGISERTVKWYVSQLFVHFDVTNRTEFAGMDAGDHRVDARNMTKNEKAAPSDSVKIAGGG